MSIAINEKVNDFVQKNRRALLIVVLAIIVILIGFITALSVNSKIQEKAFSKIDDFNTRYEALQSYIGGDAAAQDAATAQDTAAKQADISALQNELAAFAKKNTGFAAARAYSLSANIFEAQQNWAEAEKAWSACAKAAPKSYLAPVAVFNAAVAAEEQGNTDSAIGLYTQAMGYGDSFPAAARAQFSVARLEESRSNKDAALTAYRNLVSKWPNDPVWTNLAQSRIMVLSN